MSDATPDTITADAGVDDLATSAQAKIDKFIEHAVANGTVDPDKPIGFRIGADGNVEVFNVDPSMFETDEDTEPVAPFELPDTFRSNEPSLTDTRYGDHLNSHWGF